MALSNKPPFSVGYDPIIQTGMLQQSAQLEEARILQEMAALKQHYRDPSMSPNDYYKRMDDLASRLHHVRQAAAINAQMQMQQRYIMPPAAFFPTPTSQQIISPQLKPVPREDAFGEILAWRVWRVGMFPFLTSTFMTGFVWSPGAVEVAKDVEDYSLCGFHAWNDVSGARSYCHQISSVCVLGQVKLWGTVIHHEKGYRAENAKIVALDTLAYPPYPNMSGQDGRKYPHVEQMLENIRKHYGLTTEGAK